MEKAELRDSLFLKYFDVTEGILAADLVDKLSFIPYFWKLLHDLCEQNIKYFDSWSTLEMIKTIEHNGKKYLILKTRMAKYVVIDLETNQNITEEIFIRDFTEEFFVNNFKEIPINNDKISFTRWYSIENFKNPSALVDFYNFNESILNLSTTLCYRIQIEDAWTYFFLDFANGTAQLGFQTPDQFLYEQLFLKFDLTASSMQDAVSRIGKERMLEMFDKIREIKIPMEIIPKDLLEEYMRQGSRGQNKGIKLEQPK